MPPHCRRRKVRSAPFPPAAKTAPAPLRLLSPPRGARRGPFRSCPKRERAAPGVREKGALAATLHVRAKLLYGGRREMVPAGLRWLPDGRGGVRYRLDGGFPRRGCVLGRGARTHLTSSSFRAFRFATRCPGGCRGRCPHRPVEEAPSTTGQRQRKSAQRVSRTSPGWRGSQGPDVSLSDRRKGSPTFPRRNMFSFPPGAVSPTAPVRRSTSVPSKSPHHEQDKKECILWQSI